MIKGANQTDSVKQSQKEYYLVTVGHEPKGICTSRENAMACVDYYAKELGASRLCDFVWEYFDALGNLHYICVDVIKRLKMQH